MSKILIRYKCSNNKTLQKNKNKIFKIISINLRTNITERAYRIKLIKNLTVITIKKIIKDLNYQEIHKLVCKIYNKVIIVEFNNNLK